MPLLAGLAHNDVLGVEIADLADGGAAIDMDHPLLARRQFDDCVAGFLGQQAETGAGRASQFAAPPRLKLDIVHGGADRDRGKRQGVARLDLAPGARSDRVPGRQAERRQNVSLFFILVFEESDPAVAVGIVFDADDFRRDIILVALEIYDAVVLSVAAAAVADRKSTR